MEALLEEEGQWTFLKEESWDSVARCRELPIKRIMMG
jgi:hypothetical protein